MNVASMTALAISQGLEAGWGGFGFDGGGAAAILVPGLAYELPCKRPIQNNDQDAPFATAGH
jgi:hypothetical protein